MKDTIQKISILGTEKKFFGPEETPVLEEWGLDLQDSKEALLLQAAFILGKQEKAGYLPKKNPQTIEAAPADDTVPVSPKSDMHLRLMLADTHSDLLPEFLELVVQHNKRLNYHFLPDILNWGISRKNKHSLIRQVIGPRGLWLTQFNENWQYIGQEAGDIDWELAKFADRKEHLTAIRTQDPTAAIALLEKTWDQDDPAQKAEFLGLLRPNLQSSDEPFLVKASQDKRKEVRKKAFSLLALLPESAYAQALQDYLKAHFKYKKGLLKSSLEVKLPSEFDATLQSFGIDENAAAVQGGKKANWLSQVINRVAPAFWEELLNTDPNGALNLIGKTEWKQLISVSIAHAAIYHHDQKWLTVLFKSFAGKSEFDLSAIVAIFDHPTYHEMLKQHFKDGVDGLLHNEPLHLLIENSPIPFEDKTAIQLMDLFKERIKKKDRNDTYYLWQTKSLFQNLGQRINPALSDQINKDWPHTSENWKQWEESILEFMSVMNFRKEMHEGIKKP